MNSMAVAEITIRFAKTTDVLQLRDLSRSTFYETYADFNTPDDIRVHMQQTFSIEKLAAELEHKDNTFFIAEMADQMIGYAKMRARKPHVSIESKRPIELERIYVTKANQSTKVGASLMENCISHATAKGFDVLWLGVWEQNKKALSFYEEWGFTVVGKQPFILGTDQQFDVVMVRNL